LIWQFIHRDLKPENIMFERSGNFDTLKIVDFGLSTEQVVERYWNWNYNSFRYFFPKCGTPGYVAPEVLNI
jgi:serine/threonine protein kinase